MIVADTPLERPNRAHRSVELTPLDRRRALALLGMAVAGLAAPGCLVLDRVLSRYRGMLRDDRPLEEAVYRGFVDAVIPGLDTRTLDSPNLVRVFFDEDLPFADYHLDMSAHLCKSAAKHCDEWRYHTLNPERRREVIRRGIESGGLVQRLYEGTVFITQVATYANIYDDARGCRLIDYEGTSGKLDWRRMSYPDLPDRYAADIRCPGGQPG